MTTPSEAKNLVATTQLSNIDGSPIAPKSGLGARGVGSFIDEGDDFSNDAGLVSFVSGLSRQNKEDVMNSTLWAQLAANTRASRFEETRGWYEAYINLLQGIGWNLPGLSFEEYETDSSQIVVAETMIQVLKDILLPPEVGLIERLLHNGDKNGENDDAMDLYDSRTFRERQGISMTYPVSENDGVVVMTSACVEFIANRTERRFLWFEWSTEEVSLFRGAVRSELNSDIYSLVREDIIDALGDAAQQLVRSIDISIEP